MRYFSNAQEVLAYLQELKGELNDGRVFAYECWKESFILTVDRAGNARKVPLRGKLVSIGLEWPPVREEAAE